MGSYQLLSSSQLPVNLFEIYTMALPFPEIKSKHSLVAKYVTEDVWNKLAKEETETAKFTLAKAIACAVQFDDQHCGIYAGDEDSYKVFADVFEPIIQEYHGISADSKHTNDMDATKIVGNIDPKAPVKSTRIRVGRSIAGFGLSPGITKEQRLAVENLMKKAFTNLNDKPAGKYDLAGTYYPLTGMDEAVRQQLVDDHFLFMSGDQNLKVAGWRETGQKEGEYSIIKTRLSSRGSMKRISYALFPWRRPCGPFAKSNSVSNANIRLLKRAGTMRSSTATRWKRL